MRIEMALCKIAVFLTLFSLVLAAVRADDGAVLDFDKGGGEGIFESPLRLELAQLQSKVYLLEKSIEEAQRESIKKDEFISKLEDIIRVKSDGIATLEKEIAALQKKGDFAAEEKAGKAYARTRDLEKQVEQLSREVEMYIGEKDALQARVDKSENKVSELSSKLEKLKKVNDEQKTRIRITERALQAAEEEMMKAKLEAKSKDGELKKIHGAWLPHWLAGHVVEFQSFAEQEWNEHGKPSLDVVYKKAIEKSEQTKKWMEPHFNTVKTKLIPSLKEQVLARKTSADPYIKLVTTKTVEVFETSKSAVIPCINQVREKTLPYLEKARGVSKPYVDQIAASAKPHVERARVVLTPYKKKAVRHFNSYWKIVTGYHIKTQKHVLKYLKKHELTKPMASKEMAWFTASILFLMPILFLFTIVSSLFSKSGRKPVPGAHSSHGHRKHRRRHAEK